MTDLVLLYDEAMTAHDPGPGHPERPDRLRAIVARLRDQPVPGTSWQVPSPATAAAVQRVHDPAYVEAINGLRGRHAVLDPDTSVSPASVDVAWLAAGAAVDAAATAADGAAAFALVRPPGHHAERARAMGFCLFNNIAVAAAHAVAVLGFERVLVVDWDVHHGNGTQHIFEARDDVMLFSVHQTLCFPATGAAAECGTGSGAGFTVNVPLPPGCGDAEYHAVMDQLLVPIADAWRPQLILVSAGFDADARDALAEMHVTTAGFAAMCSTVVSLAAKHAGGRLALVLEGGYDLAALADGVHACVEVLAAPRVPTPPARSGSHGAGPAIEAVRRTHRRFWPLD